MNTRKGTAAMIVEPAAEFRGLTQEAVTAALADPDPNNRIACEVARLVGCYTQNFKAHCDRMGRVPASFLVSKPGTAIEAVAMNLVTEVIRQEIAKE